MQGAGMFKDIMMENGMFNYESDECLSENEINFEDDYDDENELDGLLDPRPCNSTNENGEFLRNVPPPLPLCHFDKDEDISQPRNLAGEYVRHVHHMGEASECNSGDSLHNPIVCRERMAWFTRREKLETAKIEEQGQADDTLVWDSTSKTIGAIYKDVVYQGPSFSDKSDDSNENKLLQDNESAKKTNTAFPPNAKAKNACLNSPRNSPSMNSTVKANHLVFDSNFESGNLDKVTRVYGRNKLMEGVRCRCAEDIPYLTDEEKKDCTPCPVDQEYDLCLRHDIYTSGNIQWYYFSAATPPVSVFESPSRLPSNDNSSSSHPASLNAISYPLTVRFNIINMMKSDALYNYGMKPAVYIDPFCDEGDSKDENSTGWRHIGKYVCYFKNSKTYVKKKKDKILRSKYYSLSFTYTFHGPETVYFAHCFPYTYTRLQHFLRALESDVRIASFIRRKLLCSTLANNRCDLLTITSPANSHLDMMNRPVIVLSARVHPGETNSSYMMEGFLKFITSENATSQLLRDTFVFKIVPMLNPDGVIHGNYRCSLAGVDLNRKYGNPDPILHPTIYAMKGLLKSSQSDRGVFLYLDLHGHSQQKNTFLYGCDPLQSSIRNVVDGARLLCVDAIKNFSIFSRIFPKVLASTRSLELSSANAVSASTALESGDKVVTSSRRLFSFRDSSLKVQRSKAGTGRVVSWCEIGVYASYTVEISFCGSGDNRERKLIKQYFQSKNKNAANNSSDVSMNDELRAILKSYESDSHYSPRDLLALGVQLGVAMAAFGNLDAELKKDVDICSCRTSGEANCVGDSPNMMQPFLKFPPLHEIDSYEQLNQPILRASVFSDKALGLTNDSRVSTNTYSLRIKAEFDLRRNIKVSNASGATPRVSSNASLEKNADFEDAQNKKSKLSNGGTSRRSRSVVSSAEDAPYRLQYEATDDLEIDNSLLNPQEEDCGSDSDPSGDEATPQVLAQSSFFLQLTCLSEKKLIAKRNNKPKVTKRRKKKKEAATAPVTSAPAQEKPKVQQPCQKSASSDSLSFNARSTAYNQTISTSARISKVRPRRTSTEPSGKRIPQTNHSFQDLQSPRVDGILSKGLGSNTNSAPCLSKYDDSLSASPPLIRSSRPRDISISQQMPRMQSIRGKDCNNGLVLGANSARLVGELAGSDKYCNESSDYLRTSQSRNSKLSPSFSPGANFQKNKDLVESSSSRAYVACSELDTLQRLANMNFSQM